MFPAGSAAPLPLSNARICIINLNKLLRLNGAGSESKARSWLLYCVGLLSYFHFHAIKSCWCSTAGSSMTSGDLTPSRGVGFPQIPFHLNYQIAPHLPHFPLAAGQGEARVACQDQTAPTTVQKFLKHLLKKNSIIIEKNYNFIVVIIRIKYSRYILCKRNQNI